MDSGMKRKVLFSVAAAAMFSLFFVLTWAILRVLSVDFAALGPVAGRLSAATGLVLTGYVFFDALKEEEREERSEVTNPNPAGAVRAEGV